jgi:5-oxoprolinase (ATP-hydrolysing)
MTNTRNTPIEAFETQYPARLLEYTVRRSSGGLGRAAGGDGVKKRFRFLEPVRASWVAERQHTGPWGLAGGSPGAPGSARYRLPDERRDRRLSGKAKLELPAGAELELFTPGGGGFGKPA